jgi:hypothetical protein
MTNHLRLHVLLVHDKSDVPPPAAARPPGLVPPPALPAPLLPLLPAAAVPAAPPATTANCRRLQLNLDDAVGAAGRVGDRVRGEGGQAGVGADESVDGLAGGWLDDRMGQLVSR